MNTQEKTRYAQFNTLTVTGRIFNAEIVDYNDEQFLSCAVISTATKDGQDLVYTFTNSNGLMSLHQKGYFDRGRLVTITGHIAGVSEVYTNKQGEARVRTRPEVKLTGVNVLDGGLGPAPADKKVIIKVGTPANEMTKEPAMAGVAAAPAVDEAPSYGADNSETGEDLPF